MPRRKEPSQRDIEFIRWYTSPASPTFDNAVQSAIRAGFSESYAKSCAHKRLVPMAREKVARRVAEKTENEIDRGQFYNELLRDAEQGIAERVRMKAEKDSKLLSIQQKDQHFVAERIGKDRWSQKKIVESGGLAVLDGENLEKIVGAIQNALGSAPIQAQYTINEHENDEKAPRLES